MSLGRITDLAPKLPDMQRVSGVGQFALVPERQIRIDGGYRPAPLFESRPWWRRMFRRGGTSSAGAR